MPALTDQRLAEIRDRIERAAIGLFVDQGFHGTSTRAIAREAGLSMGGLYVHYPSKEALFAAIVARYQRVFASEDNPVVGYLARTRFPDDLLMLASAIEALVLEHREFWLLWYVDVLEFGGRHFGPSFLHDIGLDHPGLAARLSELEGEGRLRVDPRIAFRMVYMHLFNFLLVELLFAGQDHYGVPRDQAITHIEDVLLHGILA